MGAHQTTQEQAEKDEGNSQSPANVPVQEGMQRKGRTASKFTTSYVHVLENQRNKGSMSTIHPTDHSHGRGEAVLVGGDKTSEKESILPDVSTPQTTDSPAIDGHVKVERCSKEEILKDPKKSYVDKLMEVRGLDMGGLHRLNMLREEAARQRELAQAQQSAGRSVMSFLDPSRILNACRDPRPTTPQPPRTDGKEGSRSFPSDSTESFNTMGMQEGEPEVEEFEPEEDECAYNSNFSVKCDGNAESYAVEDTWATLLENETQTSKHLLDTFVKDGLRHEKLAKLSELLESETQTSFSLTKDYSVQTITEDEKNVPTGDNPSINCKKKRESSTSKVSPLRKKEKIESKIPAVVPEEIDGESLQSENSDRTVEHEIRGPKRGKKERWKEEKGKEERQNEKRLSEEKGKERGQMRCMGIKPLKEDQQKKTVTKKETNQLLSSKQKRRELLRLDGGVREREEGTGLDCNRRADRTPSPPPMAELLQTIRESRQKRGDPPFKSSSNTSSKKSATRVKVMFLPERSQINTEIMTDSEHNEDEEEIPQKENNVSRKYFKDGLRKTKKLVRKHSGTTESDDYYSDVTNLNVRGKRDDSSEYIVVDSIKKGTDVRVSKAGKKGVKSCECETQKQNKCCKVICAHGCNEVTCRPSRTLLKKNSSFWEGRLKRSPSPPHNSTAYRKCEDSPEERPKVITSSLRVKENENIGNSNVQCTCTGSVYKGSLHGKESIGACRKKLAPDEFCICFQEAKNKEDKVSKRSKGCKSIENRDGENFVHPISVDNIQSKENSQTKDDKLSKKNECKNNEILANHCTIPKNIKSSPSIDAACPNNKKTYRGNMYCDKDRNCPIHCKNFQSNKNSLYVDDTYSKEDTPCRSNNDYKIEDRCNVRLERPKLINSSQSVDIVNTKGNRDYRRNDDCIKDGTYNGNCTCPKQIDSSLSMDVAYTKEVTACKRIRECKRNGSCNVICELTQDVDSALSVNVPCSKEGRSCKRNRDCKKHGQCDVYHERSTGVDVKDGRTYIRNSNCRKDGSYNAYREHTTGIDGLEVAAAQDAKNCRRSKDCKKDSDCHYCNCLMQDNDSSTEEVVQTNDFKNNGEYDIHCTCPKRIDSSVTVESSCLKDLSRCKRNNLCTKDGYSSRLKHISSFHSTNELQEARDHSGNAKCTRDSDCGLLCNSCSKLDEHSDSPAEEVNDSRVCNVYNVQCTYHRSESPPTLEVASKTDIYRTKDDYRRSEDGLQDSSEIRIEKSSQKSSSRETIRKREDNGSRLSHHDLKGNWIQERARMVEAACGRSEDGSNLSGRYTKSERSSEASLVSARTARRRAEEGGKSVTRKNMEYYMEMEALGLGRILHGQWIPKDTMIHPFDRETKNSQLPEDS